MTVFVSIFWRGEAKEEPSSGQKKRLLSLLPTHLSITLKAQIQACPQYVTFENTHTSSLRMIWLNSRLCIYSDILPLENAKGHSHALLRQYFQILNTQKKQCCALLRQTSSLHIPEVNLLTSIHTTFVSYVLGLMQSVSKAPTDISAQNCGIAVCLKPRTTAKIN